MYNFKDFIEHLNNFNNAQAVRRLSDDYNLTYSELVHQITCLAYDLSQKINVGDRVLLYKLSDIEWIKSFFAVTLLGGVAVSIDSRFSEKMVDDVVDLTRPAHVICSSNVENIDLKINQTSLSQTLLSFPQGYILPDTDPDQPCEIVFTSGTWSRPKGVVLSQTNLLTNLLEIANHVYKSKPNERFLSILPLSHCYEQMAGLFVPLYSGAAIGYLNQITSKSFKQAFISWRPHHIVLVPRIMELMRKSIYQAFPSFIPRHLFTTLTFLLSQTPLSIRKFIFQTIHKRWGGCLENLFVGGAALDLSLDKFFQGLGLNVYIGYGLSETSPLISASMNQSRVQNEVGKPLSNLNVRLNQFQEIEVQGRSVFMGYWPDISKNTDKFFNTEDIGSFDSRGNLVLMGRTKNLIIYPSGDKIFSEDVEYLAKQISGVEDACLIDIGKTEPTPVLVLAGKSINLKNVENRLIEKLPFFVKINKILLYQEESLPKTHTLKTNRKEIRDWVATR
jgi:long-chain acyl-CoA synthetase